MGTFLESASGCSPCLFDRGELAIPICYLPFRENDFASFIGAHLSLVNSKPEPYAMKFHIKAPRLSRLRVPGTSEIASLRGAEPFEADPL